MGKGWQRQGGQIRKRVRGQDASLSKIHMVVCGGSELTRKDGASQDRANCMETA